MITERNREATEKRLLDTVSDMIAENGFETIGVNAVANKSGVSKILIYRYFGSIEGLLAAYLHQNDFWINYPKTISQKEDLPEFVKTMFHGQLRKLRENPALRKLYRWELSSSNAIIINLRKQRETAGIDLINEVSRVSGRKKENIASVATMISASIAYLMMFSDVCPEYNGLRLDEDKGWQSIENGMDELIDKFFS
jgi:AcrR family transcriptional regulator